VIEGVDHVLGGAAQLPLRLLQHQLEVLAERQDAAVLRELFPDRVAQRGERLPHRRHELEGSVILVRAATSAVTVR